MPTITLNGLKHYYDDVGSGDALVMIHGANGSARSMEQHYAELSKRFRIIAPDLRSMGRSEHVETMHPSAWIEDLKALLDLLGIQRAHLYGSSLGSRVVLRMAIDHPSYARSVILTAPHTYLTKELNDNLNRYGDDANNLPPAEQEARRKNHGEDWREAHRNFYNIRNVPELQTYYSMRVSTPLHGVVHGWSEPVTKVKCPILVVISDSLSRGRGTFDHSVELKNELPDQVRLAVVPAFDPAQAGIPGELFRMLVVNFVDSLAPVAAGRR